MNILKMIKEEEINLENQKIRLKQAKTKELKEAAKLWIEIVTDRLKALEEKE